MAGTDTDTKIPVQYLSVQQIARLRGVGPGAIHKDISQGHISPDAQTNQVRGFLPSTVQEYLKRYPGLTSWTTTEETR